jgi:hypothetical protein
MGHEVTMFNGITIFYHPYHSLGPQHLREEQERAARDVPKIDFMIMIIYPYEIISSSFHILDQEQCL